jgi:hypothetical protein
MIPIKVYDKINILKNDKFNFEYGFNFMFVCNPKKL